MQLTLRQARRLEREVEALQNQLAQDMSTRNLQVSIYENFEVAMKNMQQKITKALEDSIVATKIRYAIRAAIKADNEASGLNALMNEEACLKEQAKLVNATLTDEFTDNNISIAKARHQAAIAAGRQHSEYSQAVDYIVLHSVLQKNALEVLKGQARDIQRRLMDIVDQSTALNSSRKINLDEESKTFLESYGLVV